MGAALEAVSWLQPSRIGLGPGGLSLRFPPLKCAEIRTTEANEPLGVRALLAGGSPVEFGRDRFESGDIDLGDHIAGETALVSPARRTHLLSRCSPGSLQWQAQLSRFVTLRRNVTLLRCSEHSVEDQIALHDICAELCVFMFTPPTKALRGKISSAALGRRRRSAA
jgi:hypothetical protein